ncbi:hypothetical protein Hdeb2414_s0008g00276531 [Helianthus debilis subsp. tardiflorus]
MLLVHGVSLSDEEKVGDFWHPENQMAPFTLLDLWIKDHSVSSQSKSDFSFVVFINLFRCKDLTSVSSHKQSTAVSLPSLNFCFVSKSQLLFRRQSHHPVSSNKIIIQFRRTRYFVSSYLFRHTCLSSVSSNLIKFLTIALQFISNGLI